MNVTIKDIAKMCKVSITTVSRTINGSAFGVGKKTRERILEVIRESGYRPSSIARSMITKRTNTIALVIPDICNPFFSELARGVGDAAAAAGYHLFLCNTDGSMKEEHEQGQLLREYQVDGIIFSTQNVAEDNSDIRNFIRDDYPIVLIERYVSGFDVPLRVTIDNRGGIIKLVDYLAKRGHRNIAFVGGPKQAANAIMRLDAFIAGMEKNALPNDPSLIMTGDYKPQSGYEATVELLRHKKGAFSAIILANDFMAIGACNAIADMGLKVPDDISVVGFDNLPLTGMIHPHITSMGVSIHNLGRTAAELLLARLSGIKETRHIFLDCELAERNSVRDI